ncbi:unnamed protein product, partial [Choristocarpus tenellus]
MHGVGHKWVERAFKVFSLPPLISVPSQQEPDPEFPTVAFPNPEEKGALYDAICLAEAKGVSLVLANDPDADRLAAAEMQYPPMEGGQGEGAGTWHLFSGNEIGALLGHWQWTEWKRLNPDGDPSMVVMMASTVSSKILKVMAEVEGFLFEETLPGYKWMGHRAQELKTQGYTVLFAYEEALGFGPGDAIFEKVG